MKLFLHKPPFMEVFIISAAIFLLNTVLFYDFPIKEDYEDYIIVDGICQTNVV